MWKYGRICKEAIAQVKYTTTSDTCVACRSFPHNQVGSVACVVCVLGMNALTVTSYEMMGKISMENGR